MKIFFSGICYECLEKARKDGKKDLTSLPGPSIAIELNEEGVYSYQCQKNHINWYFLQEPLFQILFDLGVLTINDGYTREAVSSFATSLERFYEFMIKLLLLSDEIDEELILRFWKDISKQSERQYGAYLSLFLNKFRKNPPVLNKKWYEFRNNVLHAGKIPSETESMEYGQVICDLIFDVLFKLREEFKDESIKLFQKVYRYNANIIKKEYPQINKAGSASMPTLIQTRMINTEFFKRLTIIDEVKRYKNSNKPRRISYIK
jgi:hypothetical protein